MGIALALVCCLVVIALLIYVQVWAGYRYRASICNSMLVGLVVLTVLFTPVDANNYQASFSASLVLYYTIYFVSMIYFLVLLLFYTFNDHKKFHSRLADHQVEDQTL
jgi:hypothetical protein